MTRSSSRSSSRSFSRTLLCAPLALALLAVGALPACGVPNTDSAPSPLACTEIGCISTLTLHVTGSAIGLSGMVTIGGRSFIVTCDDPTTNEAQCDGSDLTFQLPDGSGGGEVVWSLSADGAAADTGGHGGGSYAGNGTVTPAWNSSTPNGPDCPPTCWEGQATVELLGTP
jgi:hypothetical protein